MTQNPNKEKEKNPQQEEARITPEQVMKAFNSFGFQPNERNQNDIGYWTTKGISEGPKLMEELYKRRTDIMQKEDNDRSVQEKNEQQQATDKKMMPRLSDQDIGALFDEYGLPAPDPEWARNNLPNDPKKIRSLLEMQRKTTDDILKKQSKNAVNAMPETPKMQGMQQGMQQQAPLPQRNMMNGTGGTMPLGGQEAMMGETPPVKPFFVGDYSVVRITNPNNPNAATTWLVDAKKKVLRPFLSDQAFANAFENSEEAEKAITTLSSKELGPGGVLDGFKPLQGKQGVKDDGSMDEIEFSPAQIQKRYGKQSDPAAEGKALTMLDSMFGDLKNQ